MLRDRSGFTLIEVMVGATLLGVAALGTAAYFQYNAAANHQRQVSSSKGSIGTTLRSLIGDPSSLRASIMPQLTQSTPYVGNESLRRCIGEVLAGDTPTRCATTTGAAVPFVLPNPANPVIEHMAGDGNSRRVFYRRDGRPCDLAVINSAAAMRRCPFEAIARYRAFCPNMDANCLIAEIVELSYEIGPRSDLDPTVFPPTQRSIAQTARQTGTVLHQVFNPVVTATCGTPGDTRVAPGAACSGGRTGNVTVTEVCGADGTWAPDGNPPDESACLCPSGTWDGTSCVSSPPTSCTPGDTENEVVACPAPRVGSATRTRTCDPSGVWRPFDPPNYGTCTCPTGTWNGLDCGCSPGANETRPAICTSGDYVGYPRASESRVCAANGTWPANWTYDGSNCNCPAGEVWDSNLNQCVPPGSSWVCNASVTLIDEVPIAGPSETWLSTLSTSTSNFNALQIRTWSEVAYQASDTCPLREPSWVELDSGGPLPYTTAAGASGTLSGPVQFDADYIAVLMNGGVTCNPMVGDRITISVPPPSGASPWVRTYDVTNWYRSSQTGHATRRVTFTCNQM